MFLKGSREAGLLSAAAGRELAMGLDARLIPLSDALLYLKPVKELTMAPVRKSEKPVTLLELAGRRPKQDH